MGENKRMNEREGGGGILRACEGAAEKKEKAVILVQAVRRAVISEFYTVDLGSNNVETSIKKYSEAVLLNEGGLGYTVALGDNTMYAIGGLKEMSSILNLHDLGPDDHIHLGSSFLPGLTSRWRPGSKLRPDRSCPHCVGLGGKLYALGGGPVSDSSIGEVLDPSVGHWVDLCPPQCLCLDDFCLSSPVLVDKSNNRLLVRFRHVSSLYAFYPASNSWDCIDKNFRGWVEGELGTAVDGVIYFHIPVKRSLDCLLAYDVSGKPARKLKVVWSSHFSVNIYSDKFKALVSLGNDILCLANYIPLNDINKTNLQFARFRAQRRGDDEVVITPLAVNCYPVEGTFRIHSFIPL